jgi:hypothetical protein
LEYGITVYPARADGGRWRATWHEDGERQQCEVASEEKLATKLAKVRTRLEADAPNMAKPGVHDSWQHHTHHLMIMVSSVASGVGR